MNERDCKNCMWSIGFTENDNGCTKWDCEYVNRKEAIEAWKRTRWIPCEKELPKKIGEYVVYITSPWGGFCMIIHWDGGWNCYDDNKKYEIKGVVAWMQLPEPYNGGE